MMIYTPRQEIEIRLEFKRYEKAIKNKQLVIDRLSRKIQRLKKENKRLKQWDTNKDTRNERQRIANKKLLEENKRLNKILEEVCAELQEYKEREYMNYINKDEERFNE